MATLDPSSRTSPFESFQLHHRQTDSSARFNQLKRKPEQDISDSSSEPSFKKARYEPLPTRETGSGARLTPSIFFRSIPIVQSQDLSSILASRYIQELTDLGQGSDGRVFKGLDIDSGLPVALKINHPQGNPKRAIAEAHILKVLAEKNVCHRLNIHAGFYRNHDQFVIVTDFIPEKNIYEAFINPESPFSRFLAFSEIVTIARQCLEFLSSLRSMKSQHRDLRTTNLIFERASRYLTILDCRRCSKSKNFPSTPLQVFWQRPPEEVLEGPCNSSYDIWTLGCVLYEIFTRTLLFPITPATKTESDQKLLIKKMVEQIGFPSRIFLNSCSKAATFFTLGVYGSVQLLEGPCQTTFSWQESIRMHGAAMNCSSQQIDQFIRLLRKMLCWNYRQTPAQLLNHPLFRDDVELHVSSDFTPDDVISLYRCADGLPLKDSTPSLQINLGDHVTRTCYHIQRDPQDWYHLLVYRKQEMLCNRSVQLREGDTISMR